MDANTENPSNNRTLTNLVECCFYPMSASLTAEILINSILKETFLPEYLEVINESNLHNVPPNSETHFKVVIVSQHFEDLGRVRRHQAVYKALADLLSGSVHALALHVFTSNEWRNLSNSARAHISPQCRGGGV